MEMLKRYPEGANCKLIAAQTGINYSTTRSYLSKLAAEGSIKRKSRGIYVVEESSHSIPETKVQNFVLSYQGEGPMEREEEVVGLGIAKMILKVGEASGKITGHFSAEPPLTWREFLLCFSIFAGAVRYFTGYLPAENEVSIPTCEVNNDYYGLRLDGISCITFNEYRGLIEKVYNRKDSIRREVKISIPIDVKVLEGIMLRGVQYTALHSDTVSLTRRMDALEEAMRKLSNGVSGIIKAMYSWREK